MLNYLLRISDFIDNDALHKAIVHCGMGQMSALFAKLHALKICWALRDASTAQSNCYSSENHKVRAEA